MNLKFWKPVIIYLCAAAPVTLFCFIMLFSGNVTFFLHGFGVDSNDRLYIGKERVIEVYDNAGSSKTIPVDHLNYRFAVENGNEIVISSGNRIYRLDLDGNEISESETKDNDMQPFNASMIKSDNGDIYRKTEWFGYTRITRNDNEVVWSMPLLDYIIFLLLTAACASLVIFVVVFIIKYIRKNGLYLR